MIKSIFVNDRERRLRAGWRLTLQFALLFLLFLPSEMVLTLLKGEHFLFEYFEHILTFAIIIFSIWIAARFLDRRPLTDFGLVLNREWWLELGVGTGLGLALMTLIFAVQWVFGWIQIVDVFQHDAEVPFWAGAAGFLMIFGFGAFAEELFSRGYHLKNLAEGLTLGRIGEVPALMLAVFLSSAVFGLLHALNPNATVISTTCLILAGMLLAAGMLWTGRLALPIGLHISWNYAQGVIFGMPVSGMSDLIDARFIQIETVGPALWTGGDFGPESGLLGIFAYLLGIASIIIWSRLRRSTWRLDEGLARFSAPWLASPPEVTAEPMRETV